MRATVAEGRRLLLGVRHPSVAFVGPRHDVRDVLVSARRAYYRSEGATR